MGNMSWESAVRDRLIEDAAVAALIGSGSDGGPSIDWGELRQGAQRPAIELKLVSDRRPTTHDGFDSIRASRVRAMVQAATRAEVAALREAAIAALVPPGSYSGVWFDRAEVDLLRDAGGPTATGFVHADSVDFVFWHKG